MPTAQTPRQLNLFETQPSPAGDDPAEWEDDEFMPEFIEGIRKELTATLARVRGAARFPWKYGTDVLTAQWRFNAILHWLPQDEADRLREDFTREMARLWAANTADDEPETE